MKAVALDAATGREIWSFDPAVHNNGQVIRLRNRGVAYWKGAQGERIFHFVSDRIYAIDARTGALITSFGKGGFIDLREHLGVDPSRVFIEMTSPGMVFNNLLILGSRVNESYDASPGHIRAFDAVTGQLQWIFHTIPQPGQFGHDTWSWPKGESFGGANAWGGITIDEQRGWVFVATGSATDDFYGGFRKGQNLFANSVLALDATTGQRKWHYQTVRHDIWDYDNPPAPVLVTIRTGTTSAGRRRPAHEDGADVRARPRHRAADLPGAGRSGAALGCARRGDLADAADSAQAAAADAPGNHRSRSDEHHAGGPRVCAAGVPQLPVGSALHAADPARHAHHAGPPGWGGVARRVLRSAPQCAVRERQRGGDHQPAAPGLQRRCAPTAPSSSAGRSTRRTACRATAASGRARRR